MKKFLLSLLLLPAAAFAQDEIETDRPDQTETVAIVPKGYFQMENGFQHTQSERGASELILPTSLSKYGISDKIELRLITNLIYNRVADSAATGLEPIVIGAKINIWKGKGILPEFSLIAQAQLPKVASKNLQTKHIAPEIQLLFDNTVTDAIDIGYNMDAQWDGISANPTFEYTFSPSYKLTDQLKTYVESFGYFPPNQHADHWVDGGFIFLINKNVQIDIAGAYELSSHQHFHQYYETLGFSFRI